jgi:dTMP kinase
MARGKFIVLEGGEGSGKSSVAERLRGVLPKDTVFTRDPGGVMLGEEIRRVLLSHDTEGIDSASELLLFLAAKAQLIAERIAPALEAGHTVVSDRFILSTIAYQIYGRQHPEHLTLVKQVFDVVAKRCVPDLTLLLDLPPEVGLARVRSRGEPLNRFDEETLAFHERVREGYKKHAGDYGRAVVIDSGRPMEETWTDVLAAVQSLV